MTFALSLQSCRTDLGLEYGQTVALVILFGIVSGAWLRVLNELLPPGLLRAFAILPLVAGNFVAPKLFCRRVDATTVMLVAFNTLWLSSFKALAWALNRGPLADDKLTAIQFVATYAAPLTPKVDTSAKGKKGRLGEDAGGAVAMLRVWVAKIAMVAVVVTLLVKWTDMPGMLRSFLKTWGLYGLLSFIMDGPGVLLTGLLGMELSPHFDRPWLANSVAAFWNKRWDLAAGNTLRTLIYDPILEGRLVHNPKDAPAVNKPWRMIAGTFGSFITSGLIHEFIYWYLMGTTTGGLWLSYFAVQAPLVVIERVTMAILKKNKILVPDWVGIVVTMGGLTVIGHYLFWPATVGHCSDDIIYNVKDTMQDSLEAVQALLKLR